MIEDEPRYQFFQTGADDLVLRGEGNLYFFDGDFTFLTRGLSRAVQPPLNFRSAARFRIQSIQLGERVIPQTGASHQNRRERVAARL